LYAAVLPGFFKSSSTPDYTQIAPRPAAIAHIQRAAARIAGLRVGDWQPSHVRSVLQMVSVSTVIFSGFRPAKNDADLPREIDLGSSERMQDNDDLAECPRE